MKKSRLLGTVCSFVFFASTDASTIHVISEGTVIVGVYIATEFGAGPTNGTILSGDMFFDSVGNSTQSLGPLTSFTINVGGFAFQADPLAPHPDIPNSAPLGIVANSIRNNEDPGGSNTTDILNFQAFGSAATFPFIGVINELVLAFQDTTGLLVSDSSGKFQIPMARFNFSDMWGH